MNTPPPDTVLRQAAEWLMRLDHQPDAALHEAFQRWQAAAPQHAAAVARLQGHLAPLHNLPAQAARRALQQAEREPKGRRFQALALAVCVVSAAVLGGKHWQQGYLLADISTGNNQWVSERLADGSQLQLDGHSAVDVQLDTSQRRVRLLAGGVLVNVAKDGRPFYIDTPQGSIRALGTRFTVERQADSTVLTMLESTTLVQSAGRSVQVTAGQRLRIGANGPGTVERADAKAQEQAWQQHQLLAQDQPLADVLERLARHQSGVLLFDRQALAALRVTVMLPVDDSPRALRLLARTLPIEVTHFTPWLTRVTLKPSSAQE